MLHKFLSPILARCGLVNNPLRLKTFYMLSSLTNLSVILFCGSVLLVQELKLLEHKSISETGSDTVLKICRYVT